MLCWVLSFFYLTIEGKRDQCPWLNSQVFHVFKIPAAHRLKITAISYGNCALITKEPHFSLAEIVTGGSSVKPTSGNIPWCFQIPHIRSLPSLPPGDALEGAGWSPAGHGTRRAVSTVSSSVSARGPSYLVSKIWVKSITSYSHFTGKLNKMWRTLKLPEDYSCVRYCLPKQ